ncbi:hypothetical protein [Sphaerisporangium fuscum]|uniref:hypothetical protein n=1 Tax=Sphaerisporangium fuscum TaxID=2835868 RepID=UPI001BDC30A5|nr:hypothetical protein [Sphaerisporangium fuscum]
MRKGTTAISVGALTLALSATTTLLAAAPAAAASLRSADCGRGGILSGVCDLVDGAGEAVDDLTGGALEPVTGPVRRHGGKLADDVGEVTDKLTGKVADKVDEHGGRTPEAKPRKDRSGGHGGDGSATTRRDETTVTGGPDEGSADDGLLGLHVDAGCLPLLASPDCDEPAAPGPTASGAPKRPAPASPSPAPRASDMPGEEPGRAPAESPAPAGQGAVTGSPAPRAGSGGPVDRATPEAPPTAPPSADVETPALTPLWPGQPLPALTGRLDARPVTPRRPLDVAGTVLTAVLLASAVLAARIVHVRKDDERPASIPFEGCLTRPDTGRHRLA